MNFYYFLPGVDLLLKITAVRSWMLASFLGNLQERDWNNDLHKKKAQIRDAILARDGAEV